MSWLSPTTDRQTDRHADRWTCRLRSTDPQRSTAQGGTSVVRRPRWPLKEIPHSNANSNNLCTFVPTQSKGHIHKLQDVLDVPHVSPTFPPNHPPSHPTYVCPSNIVRSRRKKRQAAYLERKFLCPSTSNPLQ